MSVGNRVKTVRKALGISQEKFGNQIGISKVAISDIENEKTSLTERNARSICRELKKKDPQISERLKRMIEGIKLATCSKKEN